MKSNTCHLNTNGYGRERVFHIVEKVAAYCDLEKKQALQLRLLAEELIGVLEGIAGDNKSTFWIEEEDGLFKLYLISSGELSSKMREELIAVSTSGKNEAAKGIMGKIRTVFEGYMLESAELAGDPAIMMMYPLSMGFDNSSYTMAESWMLWSLQQYKEQIVQQGETHQQEWDELEKSIVANLADDITVGIQNGKAEIVVSKRFKESADK